MLLKRNLLECTIIISCSGTFLCVLLNYVTHISPITGIWFLLYISTLFIVSVCVSFKFIQWLLHLNKPLKYDLERIAADYPSLSFLSQVLPQPKKSKVECWEYDTNELSVISTVLERKLVSSWYLPYISEEIGFPFACKQMLDQMIGKSFLICDKIETKDVFVDICMILTNHLNEYQKAVKRHEKIPTSTIETLYKKSHAIFNENNKRNNTADHCTNILRVVFKELVPWELWDTPHSELLVRILSKKLDTFIDSTLAEPTWVNDKLLTVLKGSPLSVDVNDKNDLTKVPDEVPDVLPEVVNTESQSPPLQTASSSQVQPMNIPEVKKEEEVEKIEQIVEEVPVTSSAPVDIKTSPVLRQRRGRQGRNEVKIYDRIIEGSMKTWETDIDLQCISLGQDLLASLDGEITLSRLWGQDADTEGSPNPPRSKSPQPLWFGEEETIEVDPIDGSPPKETKKEQSPKPTEALLKDLQTTVTQAKTKIGDLQVENVVLDVPRKQNSSDEAAGMMEGLLDFGIAGLKKGLRFTGLSDDSQEKSPSHFRDRPHDKSPTSEVRGKLVQEYKDLQTNNSNGQRDENNVPPLLKQQRVISQDSVPSQPKPMRAEVPLEPLPDSPEPEYEEAEDLSTSIAKLRCLLQQRATTSPRSEREPWRSDERSEPHAVHAVRAVRAVDTAALADEYDMMMDRNSSPNQSSNNMQRLDKLFQRTVTGVFNSIKTAVGAEGDEQSAPTVHDWTYVCAANELGVMGAAARLSCARRGPLVEAALDPLEQLVPPARDLSTPDDFEEWCGARAACWGGVCGVLRSARLARSHVVHTLAAALLADLGERLIDAWLVELGSWLRKQVFLTFEHMSHTDSAFIEPKTTKRELNIDETTAVLLENTPPLLHIFGEDTLTRSMKLVVTSFTHKEVNKDVVFRVLDLLAGHFHKSAGIRNPSFDSN